MSEDIGSKLSQSLAGEVRKVCVVGDSEHCSFSLAESQRRQAGWAEQ